MLDVEFAELSDAGVVRDHNEDCLGHSIPGTSIHGSDRGWLFSLADGVGGHDRGEVASRLAVETVVHTFQQAKAGEALTAVLPRAIERANQRVYETAMSTGPGGSSMATTIVVCGLRYNRAVIAHVGDSRCYVLRQGKVLLMTRDHTISAEQVRMGLITAREGAAAQTSHMLSRSVGSGMFVNVESTEQQIFAGDVLLLCSDGLHNSVGMEDYASLVKPDGALESTAKALIDLAKQRDGSDNISVQLIRIKEVEAVGMYRGRHYKLR
ncbi:MAG TPA: protein phosphatase 2C domain-containing protein [Bryobacteraceae bacterium]|jgi:protein phosphatase|nr:protein phosphatase 2C domain-containing protein [Bryobacteraceae bacterium]